ncbi:DUF4276 family protein [Geminocystis herdmanii]|uniref:DUF4276 family protein n=1 Tax=Geminocystis herdmanii TaxID=669359 RepID=UPI00034B6693|nr:DUF4276 family protein [Geminocystis herdmanii]
MSYDLIFLVEEPSIAIVLNIILPKIIPDEISFICIIHQGKQDLVKSIPRKLKAFEFNPNTKFIIVHDQDSHDCQKLKLELFNLCQKAGNSDVMVRIICHELESWFLGDLLAIEKAYNLEQNTLSKKQNNQKFRNPDQLNSAKQELRNLVKQYYPATHSQKIAIYLSLTENKSKSFQVFLDGIKKMINFLK